MSLIELTRQTIRQHKLTTPGSKIVLGVSGGPDSLALLHIMRRLSTSLDLELHVATLDHGLRAAAGAADAAFVMQTCRDWALPVTIKTLSPADLPTKTENAARMARYQFLADVARQIGAQQVAVAHHADDQAETVFMHLIRGAGLQGLAGMAYSAALPGAPDLLLIRPLLDATRQEIEAYCQEYELAARQDRSNKETHLLRNRLRLEILPQLRQINPQIDRVLVHLAAVASMDADFIRGQLLIAIEDVVQVRARRVSLPRTVFGELHPALRPHYILWAAEQVRARQDLGYDHVLNAVSLALEGRVGQRALLPGGLQLRIDYDVIVIEFSSEQADDKHDRPVLLADTELPLSIPGTHALPSSAWSLESSFSPLEEPQACLIIRSGQHVTLRTRHPGDRFAPLGLDGHTQKLKQWMIDHKVPQVQRDTIPLIDVDGAIAAFFVGGRWIISAAHAGHDTVQSRVYFHFLGPGSVLI